MNRLQATMEQTRAIGGVNIELAAEKVIKRIYQSRNPAAPANEDVVKFILDKRWAYRVDGGPLLRLTEIGKRAVRELP